ncbi:MAG: hypothetical protein KJZ65_14415 [Phycisphaerales bacterium]|nr:hypothetical protein [Phycisphaerales bacterium]
MPTHDWQFWAVTGIAALAIGFGLWRILLALRRSLSRKKETSVTLTVERDKPRE